MKSIRAFFASRLGRLVLHDGTVAVGVGVAYLETTHQPIDRAALIAAGIIAGKAFLRLILPVPASAPGQTSKRRTPGPLAERGAEQNRRSATSYEVAAATLGVPVRTLVVPERKVSGRRLGRHVHHDERSRAFRVPSAAQRTVTWARHVKPYDQGQLGSCTGNAMAGALSTAPFKHRFTETRAVKLYEAATALDDVPGTYPPDDTGSSGLAVAKAAQQAGYITRYLHCFTLTDVISALQTGPCIAGTDWYSGMDTPDADGLVHVKGSIRGGHEYELVGVDVERRVFHAVNSWGTSWGLGGYFTIGWDDFSRLLAQQGDVTQPVR